MLVIGICGGSGSGKSAVCSYLRKRGYVVANCDEIYQELIEPPSDCLNEIKQYFGNNCVDDKGFLNRSVLRTIVFNDANQLERLNSITFSYITSEVVKRLTLCEKKEERAFFLEAPLLFESGLDRICHRILGIFAPYETRIRRLRERDGLSLENLRARLSSQMEDSRLRERCTDVIDNDSALETLHQQVDVLLERWGI